MRHLVKNKTFHWFCLIVVALGVRVGAVFVWEAKVGPEFGFGDSLSYWTLGRAIATDQPYRYGEVDGQIFRTPGYPTILAPLFWIGGEHPPVIWARLLNVIFGTLTVATVWWMARLLFDVRAAWIAGWVTALYPGAIVTSVFVLTEAPFGLLMMLNLILWVLVCRKKESGWSVAIGLALATGIVAGLATLVRPSWLLFLPFAIVVWLIVEAFSKKNRIGRTGVLSVTILLGFVLAMLPWWVRNFQVTSHFVPTSLQTGASLYDGLNPKADGSSNMWYVSDFINQERRQPQADAEKFTFEERVDRRMRRESLDWAGSNPAQVMLLAWDKFLRTWNIWPNEASLSGWPVKIIVCMTYLPILLLALWGGVATFRQGFSYMICWLPALYFSMLHVFFVGSIRYRQPAMLALIVLAAGLVSSVVIKKVRGDACRRV